MITTGSQGEPMSALTRIAMDDHKQIKLEPGDTVILSSRFIPGQRKNHLRLINHLYRRGAEVFHEKVSEVHVSGHASQEELKLMLNLVRPTLVSSRFTANTGIWYNMPAWRKRSAYRRSAALS